MGILDGFNLDDPQTQGLLAAAAQMLQQSGPSLRPTGLGQILGGGLSAYQGASTDAKRRKLEEDQLKQAALLRGLQIQEAQGGLADHDRARQQADQLRQFYTQQRVAQAPQAGGSPGAGAPPQLGSIPMASTPGMDQPPQQGQQGTQQPAGDPFSQRMALAQQLRGAGFHAEADAQEAQALKFKPKFDNSPHVVMGPNGKPMLVQTADDGTVRPITGGYGVAEKLAFHNLGGKTVGVDPYSGTTSATLNNTQSPDSIASNGVARDRLTFDKQQADQPKFNAEIGGFVSQPSKAAPGGAFLPLAGSPGKTLTESQGKASLFASRMDKANQIMSQLNADGTNNTSAIKGALESVPLVGGALGTVGNFAASSDQQRLEQSQRDFVNAVLRQESGASISPSEFESAQKQYFPQRGDSAAVIAQKAANRATAIQGMSLQSGQGAGRLGVGAAGGAPKGQWSIQKVE